VGVSAISGWAGGPRQASARPVRWLDAGEAVTDLYARHYRPLTRLASLLVTGTPAAEEAVQDAFVAMHRSWRRLQDEDRAVLYLMRAIVRQSRADRGPRGGEAEPAMMAAVHALPGPQREALVLRYYADQPESRIAAIMGTTPRAVRSHLACGLSAVAAATGHSSTAGLLQ
jgi:DNA-directed RNA polymerase specialized sigma24 family protein